MPASILTGDIAAGSGYDIRIASKREIVFSQETSQPAAVMTYSDTAANFTTLTGDIAAGSGYDILGSSVSKPPALTGDIAAGSGYDRALFTPQYSEISQETSQPAAVMTFPAGYIEEALSQETSQPAAVMTYQLFPNYFPHLTGDIAAGSGYDSQ